VRDGAELLLALEQRDAGDRVHVTVERNDKQRDVTIVLQAPR
jgi:hypothetical protein